MKAKFLSLTISFLLMALLLSGCGHPGIYLTITASPGYFTQAGEQITLAYTITGTGNSSLGNLRFQYDNEAINCPIRMLGPGARITCTSVYTVSEADVQKGKFTHDNTVYGQVAGCCGPDITQSAASVTIPFGVQPALALSIRADPSTFRQAGNVIAYTYTVRNSGNVEISDPIVIEDSLLQANCPNSGPLAVGAQIACSGAYTSNTDDVTAGIIRNTAVARAGAVRSESITHEVQFAAQPTLDLAVTSNRNYYAHQGDTITFTYTLTNTGNVPLNGPFQIGANELDVWNCPPVAVLLAGESLVCTGTYQIAANTYGRHLTHIAYGLVEYNQGLLLSPVVQLVIYFNPPTESAPIQAPPDSGSAVNCSQFINFTECNENEAYCIWSPSPVERCENK